MQRIDKLEVVEMIIKAFSCSKVSISIQDNAASSLNNIVHNRGPLHSSAVTFVNQGGVLDLLGTIPFLLSCADGTIQ